MPSAQFLRFSLVGAAGTAVHYAALAVLVRLGLLQPGAAAATGACLGAGVNYWLNRRLTFAGPCGDYARHRTALPRFIAVAAAGALANGVIVGRLTALAVHYFAAQILATCLILLLNFLISQKWIFQRRN